MCTFNHASVTNSVMGLSPLSCALRKNDLSQLLTWKLLPSLTNSMAHHNEFFPSWRRKKGTDKSYFMSGIIKEMYLDWNIKHWWGILKYHTLNKQGFRKHSQLYIELLTCDIRIKNNLISWNFGRKFAILWSSKIYWELVIAWII